MGFEREKRYDSVYSKKVKAGKRRTYFFDVRSTRGNDYFITITESTRRFEDDSHVRHKIFLYKEDFNRFVAGLNEVVEHVKTELMPDYDYEEFERRYDEDDYYDEERPPRREYREYADHKEQTPSENAPEQQPEQEQPAQEEPLKDQTSKDESNEDGSDVGSW